MTTEPIQKIQWEEALAAYRKACRLPGPEWFTEAVKALKVLEAIEKGA